MMNGNYGVGWMGGGWMIIIGVLVCIAIIGAVVWLVMRLQKNKQVTPLSSLPQQQHPYQMNEQGYQPPSQQSTEAYYEGEKQYSYPQSVQYPQQQERP
jgi:predicted lipid-binding transport protein (Tim44 family)